LCGSESKVTGFVLQATLNIAIPRVANGFDKFWMFLFFYQVFLTGPLQAVPKSNIRLSE
jgi:hypothetical protein